MRSAADSQRLAASSKRVAATWAEAAASAAACSALRAEANALLAAVMAEAAVTSVTPCILRHWEAPRAGERERRSAIVLTKNPKCGYDNK